MNMICGFLYEESPVTQFSASTQELLLLMKMVPVFRVLCHITLNCQCAQDSR